MGEPGLLLPLAHVGHWVLYIAPVLVVLVAVIASALHERRARLSVDEVDQCE